MSTLTGIDYLLEQLQDERPVVRTHAAQQLQRLQPPPPHVIPAIAAALERERDTAVRTALETARDTLLKSIATLRLNGRSTELLLFPPLCVCCGADDATAEGKIMKTNARQQVRFVWQRPDRIELTVPACAACKQQLDRHTLRTGVAANVTGISAAAALIFFGGAYLSWFVILLLVTWVWAYGARLGGRLYRSIFARANVVTWPDLCRYDGETLGFTLPVFQEQFRALNRG